MKLIVSLLFFLTTSLTYGQITSAIDKKTGDSVWTTVTQGIYKKNENSNNSEMVLVAVQKREKYNSIFLAIATKMSQTFKLKKEDRLYIRLVNEKTIVLSPVIEAKKEFSKVDIGRNSLTNYYLSKDDILLLKGNLVKSLRLITSKGDLEYEIEDGFSGVLQKLTNLLF